MPPYTRVLLPRFDLPAAGETRMRKNQIRALNAALDTLPRHDRFELTLPPGEDRAYPFVQLGYAAFITYTYRTEPEWTSAAVLARMTKQKRYDITAASRRLTISFGSDIERLIALSKLQWTRSQNTHDYPAIRRIWAACEARRQCCVISVTNEEGEELACSALVWSTHTLYFWLSARRSDRSTFSSAALTFWEAMKHAERLGLTFDADGPVSWKSAQSISRFGLIPVARPVINKGSILWRSLNLARTVLRPNRIDNFRA